MAGGLSDVAALAVGGQQHGMVCLDAQGGVVRDALLWNDVRSADAAAELITDLGDGDEAAGRRAWADAVGLVPVASFTAAKLRWLADAEPHHADRTAAVCLPHDWLTWRLSADRGLDTLVTDRGDASGTAYWSARTGEYRADLLELALRGRRPAVPRVAGPAEPVGVLAGATAVLGPGTGDNAAAALGLAARPGDVVVSIGTSGVVSGITTTAVADVTGTVAGFADATATTSRWSRPSTPPGCSTPRPPCSGSTTRCCPTSRCRRRPAPAGWSSSPTSRGSAHPTCPGRRVRSTA